MTTAGGDNSRLVTVVAEASLERSLVDDLDGLGVGGYTITDARGRGARGRRSSTWEHTSNIRIEVLCNPEMADRLVARLREYAANYALTLWVQEVTTPLR